LFYHAMSLDNLVEVKGPAHLNVQGARRNLSGEFVKGREQAAAGTT
jgi:hypothetical protein